MFAPFIGIETIVRFLYSPADVGRANVDVNRTLSMQILRGGFSYHQSWTVCNTVVSPPNILKQSRSSRPSRLDHLFYANH